MPYVTKDNPVELGDRAYRTIALKGQPILKEANLLGASVMPGQLVEFAITGTVALKNVKPFVQLQDTEGQNCRRAIAMENDLLGKTVNDPYVVPVDGVYDGKNGHIRYGSFHQGQEVAVRFVGIHAVVIGDALQADGEGNFEIATAGHTIIAYSLEAFTTVAGSNKKLIAVEIA